MFFSFQAAIDLIEKTDQTCEDEKYVSTSFRLLGNLAMYSSPNLSQDQFEIMLVGIAKAMATYEERPGLMESAISSLCMSVWNLPDDVELRNRTRARELGCVEMIVNAMDRNIENNRARQLLVNCLDTLYCLVNTGTDEAISKERNLTTERLIECNGFKVCLS